MKESKADRQAREYAERQERLRLRQIAEATYYAFDVGIPNGLGVRIAAERSEKMRPDEDAFFEIGYRAVVFGRWSFAAAGLLKQEIEAQVRAGQTKLEL